MSEARKLEKSSAPPCSGLPLNNGGSKGVRGGGKEAGRNRGDVRPHIGEVANESRGGVLRGTSASNCACRARAMAASSATDGPARERVSRAAAGKY